MVNLSKFSDCFVLPMFPDKPGVYVLIDEQAKVLYVGLSNRLSRRASYLTAFQEDKSKKGGYLHGVSALLRKHQKQGHTVTICFYECGNYKEEEERLIKKWNPAWNKQRGKRGKKPRQT